MCRAAPGMEKALHLMLKRQEKMNSMVANMGELQVTVPQVDIWRSINKERSHQNLPGLEQPSVPPHIEETIQNSGFILGKENDRELYTTDIPPKSLQEGSTELLRLYPEEP